MEGKLFWGQYLIWVILLLGQLHGCKSCIEKEREALLELKNDLISRSVESNWADYLPTWSNDTKSICCQWEGIECNRTSRRVIGLFVPKFLEGSSPLNLSLLHPFEEVRSLNLTMLGYNGFFDDIEGYKSLRRLRNLEILDLSSNSFNNSIFPFLSAATSLTCLSLYGNSMDGPFPFEELKDLTNLELLNLSANRFNGSMRARLTHLKKLKALYISLNGLSSSIDLQALKHFRNLELLDLSRNRLNGSMSELIHLKKLKSLDLSSNLFSSLTELQALKDLTNLEMLDLSGNGLKGSMLDLKNLINLEVLDLAQNHLDGPIQAVFFAVFCKVKSLRKLDLRGNNFVGQLPLCLGSLNKLRVLDLSSNQLNGNLPSSFGSLESLEYLALLDNNFTGLFSLNPLTNLTKLKVFKLSSKSRTVQVMTESKWQPNFQLSVVVFRLCNLEKIPSFLEYQIKLRLVDLSSNKLSGKIPTWLLVNNPELEVLRLQNNSFVTFVMPMVVHNLLVLDFSANKIGLFPDNIGLALPNLVHLNGSRNEFQGKFPSSMAEMKNLSFLDISYNNFSGELPRSFVTGCCLLNFLVLSHNKFSGHFLPRRTCFSSVVMRMDNNLFTGKIGVGLLSSNNSLVILDMSNNCITGAIPSWISKLSSLMYLVISNNFLEGTLPPSLVVMPNLFILDLSGNLFSGALPSHVNGNRITRKNLLLSNNNFTGQIPDTLLENVEILDVRNNKLFGSIPQFVHTQNIRILLLSGNKLTGYLPKQLCDLRKIRLLDLSDNKLNGFIPSCLNNLSFGLGEEMEMIDYFGGVFFWYIYQSELYKSTYLVEKIGVGYYIYQEIKIKFASKQRYDSYSGRSEFSDGILGYMNGMDLSNNELRGDIPTELGGLLKLQVMNLSHNFLSSSIPSSFSSLKAIESLDLSHNMLHGRIPQQLTSLTYLAVLDVSYNNLSGIIPQGKEFNTFNEISYIGNPLLCGPPTDRTCEAKKSSEEAYNREEEEDDEAAIDMLVFYYSAASTYVAVYVGILVLMCLNCPWRRAWLRIVDAFIASVKRILP